MSDEQPEVPESPLDVSDIDTLIDPLAGLKPRQRRLAQLLAEGKTNSEIQRELGYSASRISILQNNPVLRAEVARLQNRIFEESIETRLKQMNDVALNHVEFVLTDRTNRVKVSEKNEIAKWVIEMQKSKAPQMHDVGQNLLSVLMDKLDAKKTERVVPAPDGSQPRLSAPPTDAIEVQSRDVTPDDIEKDEIAAWIDDFCAESE